MEYGEYNRSGPDTEGCSEDMDELEMKEAEEKRTWTPGKRGVETTKEFRVSAWI